MSEMTKCNYCTLKWLKRRHQPWNVATRRGKDGWVEVVVDGPDGEKVIAWLMEVGDHCSC